MTHVQGFDNMDEMWATMAAAEDAANRELTPGQIRLRDDVENTGYWAQALPDLDLVIYGVVLPNAEIIAAGADFDVNDNRERGYLTSTAHSVAVSPRGETGDTHVSQVIPIHKDVYREAESLHWPSWSQLMETTEGRALGRLLARAEEAMKS